MTGASSPVQLRSLLGKPSAFLPLLISLAAIGVLGAHIAINGVAPQSDEGTAAHLWQLLMVAQLPIIGFFAFTWLPIAPREAIKVLGMQLAAGAAAVAPVWLLHW